LRSGSIDSALEAPVGTEIAAQGTHYNARIKTR
jgi:hypothetical protein